MFRFAREIYLLLLALLPVWVVIYVWARHKRVVSIRRFSDSELFSQLSPNASKWKPLTKFILFLLAYVFFVLALAQPEFGKSTREVKREGSEVMILLDVSNSMMAGDIQPSRLERSKLAIDRFLDRLEDDRVGLIVFAGESYVQLPMTSDFVSARMFLSTVSTDIVPIQGTAIGKAIDMGVRSFSPLVETGKTIIILTDGENHEDDAVAAARSAANKGISVHTIGVGLAQGAPIPILSGDKNQFMRDKSGQVVMSKLDENALQAIAKAGNGMYVRASNAQLGLDTILDEIEKADKTEFEATQYTDFNNVYQWPLGLALLFLLCEIIVGNKLANTDWIEKFSSKLRF